jgi:2-methylcitrate dehydratase PrpD
LQHASAVVLTKGRPTLADFDMPGADTDELAALRAKVRLTEDPALTQAYPARFGARIRVELDDGRILEQHFADALGDPERALDREALIGKARTLLVHSGRTAATAERMILACLDAQDNDPWRGICQTLD